jgi:hypothetical protein
VEIVDASDTRGGEFGTTHDHMISVAQFPATKAGVSETVDVFAMRSERARKAKTSTNADKRLGVNRKVRSNLRAGFDAKPLRSVTSGANEIGGHRRGDDAFECFVADGDFAVNIVREGDFESSELYRDGATVMRRRVGLLVFDIIN